MSFRKKFRPLVATAATQRARKPQSDGSGNLKLSPNPVELILGQEPGQEANRVENASSAKPEMSGDVPSQDERQGDKDSTTDKIPLTNTMSRFSKRSRFLPNIRAASKKSIGLSDIKTDNKLPNTGSMDYGSPFSKEHRLAADPDASTSNSVPSESGISSTASSTSLTPDSVVTCETFVDTAEQSLPDSRAISERKNRTSSDIKSNKPLTDTNMSLSASELIPNTATASLIDSFEDKQRNVDMSGTASSSEALQQGQQSASPSVLKRPSKRSRFLPNVGIKSRMKSSVVTGRESNGVNAPVEMKIACGTTESTNTSNKELTSELPLATTTEKTDEPLIDNNMPLSAAQPVHSSVTAGIESDNLEDSQPSSVDKLDSSEAILQEEKRSASPSILKRPSKSSRFLPNVGVKGKMKSLTVTIKELSVDNKSVEMKTVCDIKDSTNTCNKESGVKLPLTTTTENKISGGFKGVEPLTDTKTPSSAAEAAVNLATAMLESDSFEDEHTSVDRPGTLVSSEPLEQMEKRSDSPSVLKRPSKRSRFLPNVGVKGKMKSPTVTSKESSEDNSSVETKTPCDTIDSTSTCNRESAVKLSLTTITESKISSGFKGVEPLTDTKTPSSAAEAAFNSATAMLESDSFEDEHHSVDRPGTLVSSEPLEQMEKPSDSLSVLKRPSRRSRFPPNVGVKGKMKSPTVTGKESSENNSSAETETPCDTIDSTSTCNRESAVKATAMLESDSFEDGQPSVNRPGTEVPSEPLEQVEKQSASPSVLKRASKRSRFIPNIGVRSKTKSPDVTSKESNTGDTSAGMEVAGATLVSTDISKAVVSANEDKSESSDFVSSIPQEITESVTDSLSLSNSSFDPTSVDTTDTTDPAFLDVVSSSNSPLNLKRLPKRSRLLPNVGSKNKSADMPKENISESKAVFNEGQDEKSINQNILICPELDNEKNKSVTDPSLCFTDTNDNSFSKASNESLSNVSAPASSIGLKRFTKRARFRPAVGAKTKSQNIPNKDSLQSQTVVDMNKKKCSQDVSPGIDSEQNRNNFELVTGTRSSSLEVIDSVAANKLSNRTDSESLKDSNTPASSSGFTKLSERSGLPAIEGKGRSPDQDTLHLDTGNENGVQYFAIIEKVDSATSIITKLNSDNFTCSDGKDVGTDSAASVKDVSTDSTASVKDTECIGSKEDDDLSSQTIVSTPGIQITSRRVSRRARFTPNVSKPSRLSIGSKDSKSIITAQKESEKKLETNEETSVAVSRYESGNRSDEISPTATEIVESGKNQLATDKTSNKLKEKSLRRARLKPNISAAKSNNKEQADNNNIGKKNNSSVVTTLDSPSDSVTKDKNLFNRQQTSKRPLKRVRFTPNLGGRLSVPKTEARSDTVTENIEQSNTKFESTSMNSSVITNNKDQEVESTGNLDDSSKVDIDDTVEFDAAVSDYDTEDGSQSEGEMSHYPAKRKKFAPNLGPKVRQRRRLSSMTLSEDEGLPSEWHPSDKAKNRSASVEGPVNVSTKNKQNDQNKEGKTTSPEEGSTSKKKTKTRRVRPIIKEPKDKDKMTMFDFIYYNPKASEDSTATPEEKEKSPTKRSVTSNGEIERNQDESEMILGPAAPDPTTEIPMETQDDDDVQIQVPPYNDGYEDAEDDGSVVAPQIKIAADGSIIIDETSLILKTKRSQESLENSEIVYGEDVNFDPYRRRGKGKRKHWRLEDTLRFYKALGQVGTDFTLMMNFFPGITRQQLKKKFKTEEKFNLDLVDRALKNQLPISHEMFEKENKESLEEEESL